MLFEILEVGPRKPAGNSMIVDLRIIDQGLVPTNVTLWDQFSDTKATAISNLPGPFLIVIAYRLKLAAKSGTNLGTRNSSTFIFDPPIPEAVPYKLGAKLMRLLLENYQRELSKISGKQANCTTRR